MTVTQLVPDSALPAEPVARSTSRRLPVPPGSRRTRAGAAGRRGYQARHRAPSVGLLARPRLVALRHLLVPAVLGSCAASLVLCATLPHEAVAVPGRLYLYAVVTNVVPALPTIVMTASVARVGRAEEVSALGRRAVVLRLVAMLAVIVTVTSLGALALGVPTFARNTLILLGAGLTLGRWAGTSAACLAQVLLVATHWILGIDRDSTAYWWAWLMAPAERPSAWWAAVALTATAAASLGLVPRPAQAPETS